MYVITKLLNSALTDGMFKLVFGSRILLSLVLCAAKASGILLIYNIFTKSVEPSRASLYILLGLVAGQGLVGALLVSASCSPDRVVYVGEKAACSNTVCLSSLYSAHCNFSVANVSYRPYAGLSSQYSKRYWNVHLLPGS